MRANPPPRDRRAAPSRSSSRAWCPTPAADVFCPTRLNDTIAAGDRLEYDLVPNEGRSAHKAGNVTIPRARRHGRRRSPPAPAAVKPVADKRPRGGRAPRRPGADALEFSTRGRVEARAALRGERRVAARPAPPRAAREELRRGRRAARGAADELARGVLVVSSDHKQRRGPPSASAADDAAHRQGDARAVDGRRRGHASSTASPEALARKAITVGGETISSARRRGAFSGAVTAWGCARRSPSAARRSTRRAHDPRILPLISTFCV